MLRTYVFGTADGGPISLVPYLTQPRTGSFSLPEQPETWGLPRGCYREKHKATCWPQARVSYGKGNVRLSVQLSSIQHADYGLSAL